MKRDEIMELGLEEIEARAAEIAKETAEADNEQLEALNAELDAIEERKKELLEAAEDTRKAAAAVAEGAGEVIDEIIEERNEKKMFGPETKEYRDAFMAHLVGRATEEQRTILADNSDYGDGLALPVGIDREIWDQVAEAHPILADVERLNTGMAIKVTQITPAAISKKMDKTSTSEQTVTSAEVVLVGADYHTYITVSYTEAKMSQGAMERFLIREVADTIGEALAKDVFGAITSDAASNAVEPTGDMFADVKTALGKATKAAAPVIYAPSTEYYEIVGAIKSGTPFNIGATLGCPVKLDNAADGVVVVDPKLFVLNVIQDTTIESQRDAKQAQFVIGGYMRAQGCLRKVDAAAFIEVESES